MPNNIIDKIQLSGVTYDIGGQGGSGVSVVEVTQAEYDALPSSAKTDTSKMYVITDAEAGDLTNYYTKTETDNLVTAATATKQDTLVSGTNIKTINNQSLLGSGNIDIQGGGGKSVTGGTNISITTGETADTINCTIPYTGSVEKGFDIGTGFDAKYILTGRLFIGNYILGNTSRGIQGNSVGVCYGTSSNKSRIYGKNLVGIGYEVTLGTDGYNTVNDSVAIGHMATAKISNAVAIGSSAVASGTTKTNINNQLKIDTSNQIYIMDKTNTNEICLQDYLGGGGASYSAGTGIDITNNVISVSGVVETSAITTAITSSSTDAQVPSAKAVYDIVGNIETLLSQI